MIKFYNYDVVFSEIPDETTLAINLTNCPFKCEDCHSPHLREDIGEELTSNVLYDLLDKYPNVTCLLFMGDGGNLSELESIVAWVNMDSVLLGVGTYIKLALYTGVEHLEDVKHTDIWDYIKVGHYDKDKGDLRNPNTNQRLYQYDYTNNVDEWNDITYKFWK